MNLKNLIKYGIICTHIGDDLVSTGILEHRLQVGRTRYVHKQINANKVKTAFANMFGGSQAYAMA